MKRSKKELSTKGSIKRNSLVRTSKDSGRRDSRDETRSIISRDGSKHKSKKGKSGSRKKSSEKAESLPKIIENFEEEAEELLIEEMDLWHSLEELIFSSDKPGMLKEKMYPKKLGMGGRDECEDICNRKCLDSRIRLPPIKRTNSENILWDIRGLPGSQPVESIPVLVVDRVNVRRKERHDNILMQLSSKMNEVNEIIEKEIRKQAENVVAHINLIKENVDNILDIIEEKQCIGLSKNVINRMQEIMKQLNDNRLSKIDSFCNFIRKLEAQRSESFKHILKKVYKDMHDNMYLLPYEIQKFFENKIQHLNQITMNNYHCYTELEGKLKLQMEEEMKIWFQKLKVYEKIKKKKTTTAESPEAAQEADEISAFDAIREKKKEMSKKLDDAEANFQDLLQATSMSLYLKSHHILDVYRTYLTEMMHVATSMIRADLIDHSEIQLGFASIHALSVQYGNDEDEIRDIIRAGIRDMTQSLDSNLKNFSHSTRIFDGYIDRMLEMTELCQKHLVLTVMRNDKATMRMNANINILVDKLRQDSSETNLDKTLNEIMSIVSNIDAMLLSNLKEEVSVVDKVHQLTMLSVDVMIDEIGRFVEQIPPPTDSDPRVMKKRASWLNFEELKNNDHLFSEDFLNCRFMIDAINNWQFGIWQVLITIMDFSKQAISNIVQETSNNKKRKLKYRCELKMKINNLRMQSIKEDFYKVRLIELRAHDDRLKQHRMGVEDNIMKLNHLHKEMELLCRDFIDTKYIPKIMNAMSLLEKVSKKRHLNEIKQNVQYLHSMILQEMKPTYDRISSAQFQILTNLKNSHLAYLKSIRFFSEDGNFTVDEVKNLKKQMGLLEKRLTKEFNTNKNTITKTYDASVEECRNKRKAYLHSLDKSIEEFTFKEDVEHKIKELNSDIRSGIYDVIYEVRNLETKFKNLKGASYNESNIGDMDWMPTFVRCFSEIQADIESIHDKLAYFDWAPLDDKFLKRRTLHSPIDSMVSAKSSKSISEVQKSQSKLHESKQKKNEKQRNTLKNTAVVKSRNYIHILYPSVPEPEDSFLSKLHCKIFSSFSTIQEMAKIFYDKHEEIMNKDLVIPEYKTFIEDVLAKYKYYQLQLEFVWLECIAEFIKLVTSYQKYLDDYYKDTLIKYFEVRKEQLKKIYDETIKNLEDNIKSIEEYYMNAHGKLKTMFGHPNMSNMLTTIEQYITKADGFAKKVLLNNLMPCKENIKDHCANTESTFLDLEQILSCIKGSTKSISLKNDLENQLLEKTERMQRILSLTDEPVDEEVNDYHVVQSVAKKLKVYKDKAQIPPEIEISYTNIIKSRSSSHSSIRILDTELLLKENYGDYEIYCEKVDSFQEKCNAIQQKYKTILKQDIERIIKLYQVKYNYSTIE